MKPTSPFLLVFGNPDTREHLKLEMSSRFLFSRFAFSHERLTSFKFSSDKPSPESGYQRGAHLPTEWDLRKLPDVFTAESFGIFLAKTPRDGAGGDAGSSTGSSAVGDATALPEALSEEVIPEGYRIFSVPVKNEIWWGLQKIGRHGSALQLPSMTSMEYSIESADRKLPSRSYYKLKEMCEVSGSRISSGETVFEIGCSPGGMSFYALEQGAKVIGVDRGVVSQLVRQNPDFTQLHYSISDTPSESIPESMDYLVIDMHAEPRVLYRECQFLFQRVQKAIFLTLKLNDPETVRQLPKIHEQLKEAMPWRWSSLRQLPSHHQEVCFMGIL